MSRPTTARLCRTHEAESAPPALTQVANGSAGATAWQYLGTGRFWFESFRNWQSAFMVVAVVVGASVHLRQRGSKESKPVAAPHSNTPS